MAKAATNRRIEITITAENRERAIRSHSGGCLIADALKEKGFTGVTVDMATIRVTDRAAGKRYIYLTPENAQHVLLAWDQGWPNPVETVTLRKPVKVVPVRRGGGAGRTPEDRAARIAELEAKVADGTATGGEKRGLKMMKDTGDRPVAYGETRLAAGDEIIVGGHPPKLGDPHPNLLRGRHRHFGAKLADPGIAFREAVEAEVERRAATDA